MTHVKPGTDPYQRYDEDNPAEMVELEVSTDEEVEDADDLSEVSLMSQGDVTPAELKTLLAGISTAHKQMAEAVDLLQERVQGMTLEQVDDTAVAVSSEVANVRGLAFMTSVFDQEEMALALAVGTRRLQEWQVLTEKRKKNDLTSYARLQEIFGHNARTISECAEVKKYRYTKSTVSNPTATKTVVRYQHTEYLGKSKSDEAEPGTSADPNRVKQQPTPKTFGPFQDHPNLPKGEIDLEKLVVNVPIELARKSVNAPSGFSKPFKAFVIVHCKAVYRWGHLKDVGY